MNRTFAALLLLALAGPACEGTTAQSTSAATRAVAYSKDAESNYKLGMARLEDKLYNEAIKYFTFVKDRFPYSKYAALADLRIADARFLAREFTDAVDQYKRFIRLHPSHEEVPYATFRIGYSFYKQLPKDWFLVPPTHTKDLTAVEDSLKALEGYRKAFPDDKNGPEADKLIVQCRRTLADHEYSVATFYRKRERWPAVAGRLEVMRTSYLGVGLDEEIFAGLVEARVKLKEIDKACAVVAQYRTTLPKDPQPARLDAQLQCSSRPDPAATPAVSPALQPPAVTPGPAAQPL